MQEELYQGVVEVDVEEGKQARRYWFVYFSVVGWAKVVESTMVDVTQSHDCGKKP